MPLQRDLGRRHQLRQHIAIGAQPFDEARFVVLPERMPHHLADRGVVGGRSVTDHGVGPCYCGVQSTSPICRAPAASITSRSNPIATPLAGGMCASAARKSSSIGQRWP